MGREEGRKGDKEGKGRVRRQRAGSAKREQRKKRAMERTDQGRRKK